jgi:hypothetical protein
VIAAYNLPNRVYCAQLKGMTSAMLEHSTYNILLYAALELLSFIVLVIFLKRKLELSPLHHLAFVLETQWRLIQSKLILWTTIAVQMSLEHFGTDYSFQFAWLHSTPTLIPATAAVATSSNRS